MIYWSHHVNIYQRLEISNIEFIILKDVWNGRPDWLGRLGRRISGNWSQRSSSPLPSAQLAVLVALWLVDCPPALAKERALDLSISVSVWTVAGWFDCTSVLRGADAFFFLFNSLYHVVVVVLWLDFFCAFSLLVPRCQISTSFLFLFHQFLFRSFKFASLLSYPSAYTYTDPSQTTSSNSRSVLSPYFSSTQCESTEVYWI